jgi:predicted CXXCH cytochrome family protein
MLKRSGLLVVLVILSGLCPVFGAEGGLRIVFPPDRAILDGDSVEVIGLAPAGMDEVRISVSPGEIRGQSRVAVVRGAFRRRVTLPPGKREIVITPLDGRAAEVRVRVFVKGRRAGSPPAGYRRYYRHPFELDVDNCLACHRQPAGAGEWRRLRPAATCQDGGCHEEMGRKKYVHGPVGAGTCIHCHNPHGSVRGALVSREGKDVCLVCHRDAESFWERSNIHFPVEDGDCTGCHSPHESNMRYQLRGTSMKEVCGNCHDVEELTTGKAVHDPVASGECTVCHDPHSSDHPRMLDDEEPDFCFGCHFDKQEEVELDVPHMPAMESCLQCHDVHSSAQEHLLSEPPGKLCLDCHKEVTPDFVSELQGNTVQHEPVAGGRCPACHLPHGSRNEKLLAQPAEKLCFTCHTDIGRQVQNAKYPHGPVLEGDCIACHQPHGSKNPRILNAYFPAEFYLPYDEKSFALCFECHNADVAREERTTKLTDFRNGDRNLHYLHVHKSRKGRSCKACHEVHGGSQEKHIREEVPYGEMWSYPIRYTKTATGGSCVVGCHKPKAYDRRNPVVYR